WRAKQPLQALAKGVKGSRDNISPRYIVEEIGRLAGEEAVIVTDVGQHQMWAAQYYPVTRPRGFLTSGGLGTMGYGFPAAIGAKFACPDRTVVLIGGDGGFQMNIQELTTAVSNKIHVVIALFDNQALGMVRQWQNLFHDQRYSSVDLKDNPDFVKVAEAFGGRGRDVHDPEEVTPALEQALAARGGPFLLRFRLHNDENVFPIVPAGAGLDEAIGGGE
ncbi:MAG: acetolactate synthase large subunit, partial [Planctomycetes bacterium]|nr:acetolactate synthase large subunit [Planctomycetota bacterium]